jgi:hypothetical protein
MGVEKHSYGTSCGGTVSRRHFVMAACGFASAISALHLLGFLNGHIGFSAGPMGYGVLPAGAVSPAAAAQACTGAECYEIWSCYGWKDATLHWREPFGQLLSALFFGLGFFGAATGNDRQLQTAGDWLLILGACYVGMGLVDAAYVEVCGAYSSNLVHQTLAPRAAGPLAMSLSPLGPGIREKLLSMAVYPVELVDGLTGGLHALRWHLLWTSAWSIFVIYTALETRILARFCGHGALGLGVNYGLDQWDEAFDHNAIRIHQARLQKSKFVSDATLPFPFAAEDDSPRRGFAASMGALVGGSRYGSAGRAVPHLASKQGFQYSPGNWGTRASASPMVVL